MRKMRTWLMFAGAALAAAALGGCAGPWERNFVAAVAVKPDGRAGPASVTVREAPWSRVESALGELEKEIAASDVHPDEWPVERKRAAEATLLKALQVSEGAGEVVILGRSVFSSTDRIDPRDGSLAKFAARIGADYAIWSRTYRRTTDRIVTEPVTTFSSETVHFRDRAGKRRSETISGWHTTYVPVVVAADEWAWVAFFVRKSTD